jgi:hypothetical protein
VKQLKENEGIERSLLLAMAVIAGLTVANCYYNQPLLEMIRHDIGVSQHEANLITVVTQTGYALGLCFLIPMGDLYSRRRIIVVNMTVAAMMAIVIAVAHKVWLIWGASLLLGACSVIPQFFIPIAGQYSEKKNKSRNMNNTWGYGRINAIKGLKQLLGTTGIDDVKTTESMYRIITDRQARTATFYIGSDKGQARVAVYNLTGQLMYSAPINSNGETISLSSLPHGVYVFKLTQGSNTQTIKSTL